MGICSDFFFYKNNLIASERFVWLSIFVSRIPATNCSLGVVFLIYNIRFQVIEKQTSNQIGEALALRETRWRGWCKLGTVWQLGFHRDGHCLWIHACNYSCRAWLVTLVWIIYMISTAQCIFWNAITKVVPVFAEKQTLLSHPGHILDEHFLLKQSFRVLNIKSLNLLLICSSFIYRSSVLYPYWTL